MKGILKRIALMSHHVACGIECISDSSMDQKTMNRIWVQKRQDGIYELSSSLGLLVGVTMDRGTMNNENFVELNIFLII